MSVSMNPSIRFAALKPPCFSGKRADARAEEQSRIHQQNADFRAAFQRCIGYDPVEGLPNLRRHTRRFESPGLPDGWAESSDMDVTIGDKTFDGHHSLTGGKRGIKDLSISLSNEAAFLYLQVTPQKRGKVAITATLTDRTSRDIPRPQYRFSQAEHPTAEEKQIMAMFFDQLLLLSDSASRLTRKA